MRLHGAVQLYVSGYDRPGRRRAAWDVFVYFDDDANVRAPFDALSLVERLELTAASRAQRDHFATRLG